MDISSLQQIKKELEKVDHKQMIQYCLKLASYKRDNKLYLNYLLFESENEITYKEKIQSEILKQFEDINDSTVYYLKKRIRKTKQLLYKYVTFTEQMETHLELYIFFLKQLHPYAQQIESSKQIQSMILTVIRSFEKKLSKLHEDLQYDFRQLFMHELPNLSQLLAQS